MREPQVPDYEAMEACTLLKFKDAQGVCGWCGTELPKRRRRWCSDECATQWPSNHYWSFARVAAIRRDQWTCRRCGFIGWRDMAYTGGPFRIGVDDPELHPTAPSRGDWAIALGLLSSEDWKAPRSFDADSDLRWWRIEEATRQLPEAVQLLIEAESRIEARPSRRRYRQGSHELEVNHIHPVRGYRAGGCHHHQDNLETLCRPCHVAETRLQIVSTRSPGGSRTIACWEGLCDRCFANNEDRPEIHCWCPHHRGLPLDLPKQMLMGVTA